MKKIYLEIISYIVIIIFITSLIFVYEGEIEKLEYCILADAVEIEGYRVRIELKDDVIQGLITEINSDF